MFCTIDRILPVPGWTTAAAAPMDLLPLPTGTRFSRSFWACFWICGSSVVWMVRPPRLMFLVRSAIVLPSAGCCLSQAMT